MTTIERLISTCKDDEHLLAYGRVLDPERRTALQRLARQRGVAIDEMRAAARTLRGAPQGRRSVMSYWRGWMLDLRFAVGGSNAGDVIRKCLHSQRRLEERFTDAAADPAWPKEMHNVLEEQRARAHDARDVLIGLV